LELQEESIYHGGIWPGDRWSHLGEQYVRTSDRFSMIATTDPSSRFAVAAPQVAEEFGVAEIVAVLGVTLYLLGYVFSSHEVVSSVLTEEASVRDQ
jgi:hypothetical protein